MAIETFPFTHLPSALSTVHPSDNYPKLVMSVARYYRVIAPSPALNHVIITFNVVNCAAVAGKQRSDNGVISCSLTRAKDPKYRN